MARKKPVDDLGKLSSDVLSEFDIDTGQPDTKGRTVSKAAKAVANVAIGTLSGAARGVEGELRTRFPNTAGLIDDAVGITGSMREIGSEAAHELGTTFNTLKGITLKMMPMAKAIVPSKLYNKIETKLKKSYVPEEEEMSEEQSRNQARNASIEQQIQSIMSAQSEFAQLNAQKDTAEKQAQALLQHTQFKADQKLFSAMDRKLEFMNVFLSGAFTAYMKKSLELKYKHLYVANDTFQVVKLATKIMENKLEEIKHNTSLPEYAKVTMKERLMGSLKEKTVKGVSDFVSGWRDKLVGNIKETVLGNIKSMSAPVQMLASMAGMMDPSMMGGGGASSAIGSILGLGANFFTGVKTSNKLDQKYGMVNDIENRAGLLHKLIPMWLSKFADKNRGEGGWRGLLASILPSFKPSTKIKTDDVINEPNKVVPFDASTRAAIVEVIPAHLERIGNFVEGLARYIAPDMKVVSKGYDHVTKRLENSEDIEKNFLRKKLGEDKDVAAAVSGVMSASRAIAKNKLSESELETISKKDFLDAEHKFATNMIASGNFFEADQFHEFVQNPSMSNASKYIKEVFKGIDPRVAQQLASYFNALCYNGNRPDGSAINMLVEKYSNLQDKLPMIQFGHQMVNQLGMGRHTSFVDIKTGELKDLDRVLGRQSTAEINRRSEYDAAEFGAHKKRIAEAKEAINPVDMPMYKALAEDYGLGDEAYYLKPFAAKVIWSGFRGGKYIYEKGAEIGGKVKAKVDEFTGNDMFQSASENIGKIKALFKDAATRLNVVFRKIYKSSADTTIVVYDVLAPEGDRVMSGTFQVVTAGSDVDTEASWEDVKKALFTENPNLKKIGKDKINGLQKIYEDKVKAVKAEGEFIRLADDTVIYAGESSSSGNVSSGSGERSFQLHRGSAGASNTDSLLKSIIEMLRTGGSIIRTVPYDGTLGEIKPGTPPPASGSGPAVIVGSRVHSQSPGDIAAEAIPTVETPSVSSESSESFVDKSKKVGNRILGGLQKGWTSLKEFIPDRNSFLSHIPEKYRDKVGKALDKCVGAKDSIKDMMFNLKKNLGNNKHVKKMLDQVQAAAETIKDPIKRREFIQEQISNVCDFYDTIKDKDKRKDLVDSAKDKMQGLMQESLKKIQGEAPEGGETEAGEEQPRRGFFGRIFDWVKGTRVGKWVSSLFSDDTKTSIKDSFTKAKDAIKGIWSRGEEPAKTPEGGETPATPNEPKTSQGKEAPSEGSDKADKLFSGKPESKFHADFRAFANRLFAYVESGAFGRGGGLIRGVGKLIGKGFTGAGRAIAGIAKGYGHAFGGLAKGAGAAVKGIFTSGIPSALIGAAGNTMRGVGSLVGGLAKGYGTAAGGLFKGLGSAIGPAAKGVASGIGNILFPDWGEGSKSEKSSSGGGVLAKIKGFFKPKYVDIYLKDQVDPGKPLLSAKQQEDGVHFEDGSKVESSADITKPVFGKKPGEKEDSCLITEDNIKHGLVDVKNQPLGGSGGFKAKGILDRLGLPGKILKWAGKGIGAGFDIWGSLIGLGATGAKGIIKTGKTILGRIFGIDGQDFTAHHKGVEDRLDKIIEILTAYTGYGAKEGSSPEGAKNAQESEETPNAEGSDSGQGSETQKGGRFKRLWGRAKAWFNKRKQAKQKDTVAEYNKKVEENEKKRKEKQAERDKEKERAEKVAKERQEKLKQKPQQNPNAGQGQQGQGGGWMDWLRGSENQFGRRTGGLLRNSKAFLMKAARSKIGRKFGGKYIAQFIGKPGATSLKALKGLGGLAKTGGGKLLGAAGKLAAKVGLKGIGSKLLGSAALKGLGALGGKALGALAGPWGLAALAAGYSIFKGIKGAGKEATKKNLGIKEGVQVQDRFASGLSQALTFGFGGKRAAKFTKKALHWMPGYGLAIGLTKAIMGDKEAMSDQEIAKFRKKCENNIKKGMKGYDTILGKFNKAVRNEDWPLARAISGNEKSIWKDLFWAPIQQFKDVKNLLFGNDEKPMTAGEIKAFRKTLQVRIKKDKDKMAENLLKKFDEAVADGDWKQARKLSGKEATGLLNGKSGGRNTGALIGMAVLGPLGALGGAVIGDLFDDPNAKPLSKSEIKDTQKFLAKQMTYNPKARDILDRFNTAVEGGDWKTARRLSSKKNQHLITKILKPVGRNLLAVATLGISELVRTDDEKPMTEKEIQDYRKKMMYKINKKGDKVASKKLEAFDEAIAQQNWKKARAISKIHDESIASKLANADKWMRRNLSIAGLFMDDDNSKPMTEAEIQKFRTSMERKIKLGDRKAQQKLDKFNDAVGEQRWQRARAIAKMPNENFAKTAVKAVGTFFDNLLGSGEKTAMTELEIKKARDAFQDRIKNGDKKAEKLLAKFDDAVADENWKRARAIAGVKTKNWVEKGAKAVGDWIWSGDQDSAMTDAEVQMFEQKMQAAIAKGDKGAQKRLDQFHEAISNGLWEKARRISDTKAEGWFKSMAKGIGNVLTFGLFKDKNEVDPNDLENIRKKIEEKTDDDASGNWQKVYDRFIHLTNQGMHKEAYDFGEKILDEGLDSSTGDRLLRETRSAEDIIENMKITARQQDLVNAINKSKEKFSWWTSPFKRIRLANLGRAVENAGNSELSEEALDQWSDQLKQIDDTAEIDSTTDYQVDKEREKIIEAQVLLRNRAIETRNKITNWFLHPFDYRNIRKLAEEITYANPGEVTDDQIGEWFKQLAEFKESGLDMKEFEKAKEAAKQRAAEEAKSLGQQFDPDSDEQDENIQGSDESLGKKLSTLIAGIGAGLTKKWKALTGKAKELWGNMKDKASEMWSSFKEKAGNFWGGVKDRWSSMADKAKDIGEGIKERFGKLGSSISNSFKGLFGWVKNIPKAIKGGFFKMIEPFTGPIKKVIKKVKGGIDTAKEKIANISKPFYGVYDYTCGLEKKIDRWTEEHVCDFPGAGLVRDVIGKVSGRIKDLGLPFNNVGSWFEKIRPQKDDELDGLNETPKTADLDQAKAALAQDGDPNTSDAAGADPTKFPTTPDDDKSSIATSTPATNADNATSNTAVAMATIDSDRNRSGAMRASAPATRMDATTAAASAQTSASNVALANIGQERAGVQQNIQNMSDGDASATRDQTQILGEKLDRLIAATHDVRDATAEGANLTGERINNAQNTAIASSAAYTQSTVQAAKPKPGPPRPKPAPISTMKPSYA